MNPGIFWNVNAFRTESIHWTENKSGLVSFKNLLWHKCYYKKALEWKELNLSLQLYFKIQYIHFMCEIKFQTHFFNILKYRHLDFQILILILVAILISSMQLCISVPWFFMYYPQLLLLIQTPCFILLNPSIYMFLPVADISPRSHFWGAGNVLFACFCFHQFLYLNCFPHNFRTRFIF